MVAESAKVAPTSRMFYHFKVIELIYLLFEMDFSARPSPFQIEDRFYDNSGIFSIITVWSIYKYIYIYAEWYKHMVHCLQWFPEFQCKCQCKRIGAMFPGNVPCNDPVVAAVLPLRWHKHCWRAARRASRPIFQVMQSFDQVSSILDVLEECHSYSSD
jgi:hypothetical protein